MRCFILGLVLVVFLSCSTKEKPKNEVTIVDGATKYEVYQPSEMSLLMKEMYAYNQSLKKDIEAGRGVSVSFPEQFLNIHKAKLSETKLRNQTFNQFSQLYIESQRLVFVEDSNVSLKERHNNAVNMCLACHKTECTGPIPKIKKLLIN